MEWTLSWQPLFKIGTPSKLVTEQGEYFPHNYFLFKWLFQRISVL